MPRKPRVKDEDAPWVNEIAFIFPGYKVDSIRARMSAWRNFCAFIKDRNMMANKYN